jgi:radical SAM superfamily enzyme YgiQ (UPF0313 family)
MRADQGSRLPEDAMALCRRSGLRRVIIGVEAGTQEMLDRIKKDIKLEQVFESAEKCLRHGVAVIFPFIVGFPGEPDESVKASLAVAKRLRAMSPSFETPVFYFKPYPGTALTDEAVADGYALPCTLDDWSRFDIYGSEGPWVSPEVYRRVERFKFYQRIAWTPGSPLSRPIRQLARWRLRRDAYGLPIEKLVADRLWPQPELS